MKRPDMAAATRRQLDRLTRSPRAALRGRTTLKPFPRTRCAAPVTTGGGVISCVVTADPATRTCAEHTEWWGTPGFTVVCELLAGHAGAHHARPSTLGGVVPGELTWFVPGTPARASDDAEGS